MAAVCPMMVRCALLRAGLIAVLFAAHDAVALAQTAPRSTPAASPGPCEQAGALGAIVDRPGLGRPIANNGSPCVVPRSQIVVEVGYRTQTTTGSGVSTLTVFPLPLVRFGLGDRNEFVVQLPTASDRSGATLGGTFVPASGVQDAGAGFKRMLDDRANFQDAVTVFVTVPTGTPQGATGFSAGAPTYALSYTAAFALSGNIAASVTQSAIANAAPTASGGASSFFSYQPSLALSYGFAPNFNAIVSDQITTPLGPTGGTGNRALLALQRVLTPGIVLDAEYEVNALPASPVARQHAFGIGAAFELGTRRR